MITAAEIRADMAATLRGAAQGYRALGVGRFELADVCRTQARNLERRAEEIEQKEKLKAEMLTAQIRRVA